MRSICIKNKQTTDAIIEIVEAFKYEDDDHHRIFNGNEMKLKPGEEHKFVIADDSYYQLWQVIETNPLEWAWDSIIFPEKRKAITYVLEDIDYESL
jgi:hypothetical protein